VEALPKAEQSGNLAAENAALRAGHSALIRAFVGLEDGSFIQYPAREVTADPRGRPWYIMAAQAPELHWTRPVVDATKRTLRISAVTALRSHRVFFGVAGCDLRVSSLAQQLRLDVPGFRKAYLVADGKIVVSETLEALVLPKMTSPDQEPELPSLDDPALAQRIASSERGGYLESGERLFVFSKLISPPWAYVAELDRAKYIER
jgi:hypothetical protein